jgi:hypothetical protein
MQHRSHASPALEGHNRKRSRERKTKKISFDAAPLSSKDHDNAKDANAAARRHPP